MLVKVYLDLVFLINFCYDFLIIMTIDLTLKRKTSLRRMVMSALVGSLSLGLLFLPFADIILFFFKIIVSFIMVIIAFKYRNLKYFGHNLFYLYMISITLGGFLYFLNNEFSYQRKGLVFFFDKVSPNYVLLIIIAPIILYLYLKEHKLMKSTYNLKYEVKIVFNNREELTCQAFLDSGNKLKDPVTNKYIILVAKDSLKNYIKNKYPIYVPYVALNKTGVVKCFKIKTLIINNQQYSNYLVGEALNDIKIAGVDCLLNGKLMEDLCFEK